MRCKVIKPRLMSGEKIDDIIELYNIQNLPKRFFLFGGEYEKEV